MTCVLAIAACATPARQTGPAITPSIPPTTVPATPALPATPLAPRLPAPTATVSAAPSSTPEAILAQPRLEVLADGLTNPDDLLSLPDGSFYLSDVGDGTIRQISPDGKSHVVLTGLKAPEGMVLLPDGWLVFVEQELNRLDRWDRQSPQVQPWLTLENATRFEGVDNIALDARPGAPPSLIIPDSPNNRVLRLSLDGKQQAEIARGLNRPTGAWVEPDGSLLVVEENGNTLDRIHPDGRVEILAKFSIPDDVVEDAAGNIFVCTLGDGGIYWLAPKSNQPRLLVSGLSSPQGLTLDSSGNLLVTDPGHHRLVKVFLR